MTRNCVKKFFRISEKHAKHFFKITNWLEGHLEILQALKAHMVKVTSDHWKKGMLNQIINVKGLINLNIYNY